MLLGMSNTALEFLVILLFTAAVFLAAMLRSQYINKKNMINIIDKLTLTPVDQLT